MQREKGFTLIEIVAVLGIIGILISVTVFSFSAFRDNSNLGKNISQAKSVLEEARYESISGKSNYSYGVKINSADLTLFQGASYASSTRNTVYSFDGATTGSISLNGGGSEIVFVKNSGSTNNFGTFQITMTVNTAKRSTIAVTNSGLISEQ